MEYVLLYCSIIVLLIRFLVVKSNRNFFTAIATADSRTDIMQQWMWLEQNLLPKLGLLFSAFDSIIRFTIVLHL